MLKVLIDACVSKFAVGVDRMIIFREVVPEPRVAMVASVTV